MKTIIKSLICEFVARLPPGGRQAVFERLYEMQGPDNLFLEMALKRNVVAVSVSGEYGTIRQGITDRTILRTYMKSGRWAEDVNDTLIEFFAANGGGTYIDVGANIGLTTIPVAQNPKVRCIALEPEPNNFEYLTQNVKANCEGGNVTLKRVAAFSRRDTVSFELSPVNFGSHRIHLHDRPGRLNEQAREIINVEAAPLDDIVPNHSGPMAIKLDTEGGEPYVIAGGQNVLNRAELILMEFWPYGMDRMGGDPEEVFGFIQSGFKTVSYTEGEEMTSSSSQSPVEAADHLRKVFHEKKRDNLFYLNLRLRR